VAETWTILKVLEWTTGRFAQAGIDSPRLEAQVLLGHVLGCDRVSLYTSFDKPLGPDELGAFRALIKRRLAGEPVAYLVGEQEFWSLPFRVDPRVLIPRRDTQTLIEEVLDQVGDRAAPLAIAEIATGSGAIAVTLAHELSAARVVATDISDDALAVAADNAQRNEVADRVALRAGDLAAPLAGDSPYDVLVANLPYVPTAELETLSPEVRAEPRGALDGGADGLDLIRRLVAAAPAHLRPGGLLVLEHALDQHDRIAALLAATGAFEPAAVRADLAGHPRVTYARRR
jgi:release factor glutamine methyltransferase